MANTNTATRKAKTAGIILTAALLAGGFTHASASGQLPIFKACLAEAAKASNPEEATNQCYWNHWELMAEYG